jgi:exonuclease SbcC
VITRIELHNFMSHRATVIEPSPGLTVLVGPNNCGKSAVIAALQVLSQNRNSKLFTRHGEKRCSVVVHTSEGHVVEWRRKDSPSYRVNGQVFDRLGRSGVPEELQSLLRLPMVGDEDDESFNIHFGNQKSPIFLLNSSPGTAAKFFASSSDAIRLVEMQQRHLQRVTDARRQRKQLEAEAVIVNAELEALDATVPLADQLTDLESLYSEITRLGRAIDDLHRDAARLVERSDRVELHTARTEALAPLHAPPELPDPAPLDRLIGRVVEAGRVSQRLVDESRSLEGLPNPPTMEDVAGLDRLLRETEVAARNLNRLEGTRDALAPLQAPPALSDLRTLEVLIRRLHDAMADEALTARRCQRLERLGPAPAMVDCDGLNSLLSSLERQTREVDQLAATAATASGLISPPELIDDEALSATIEDLAAAEAQMTRHRDSLATLEDELAEAAARMREAVAGQSCPTCGQPFDAEQLLAMSAGGHVHG